MRFTLTRYTKVGEWLRKIVENIQNLIKPRQKTELLLGTTKEVTTTEKSDFKSRMKFDGKVKSSKDYELEISEAVEKCKKLIDEQIELSKEITKIEYDIADDISDIKVAPGVSTRAEKAYKANLIYIATSGELVLPIIKSKINANTQELLTDTKRANSDEKIAKLYSEEEITLIEEKLSQYSEQNGGFISKEVNLTELAEKMLKQTTKKELLNIKKITEINAEIFGIKIALINAIKNNQKLPKELEEIYENTEEYQKVETDELRRILKQDITKFALTESEKRALENMMENLIFEKTALQTNKEQLKETISQMIEQDKREGKIIGVDLYYHALMLKMLDNAVKGANTISPSNKRGSIFVHYYEDDEKVPEEIKDTEYRTMFYESKEQVQEIETGLTIDND